MIFRVLVALLFIAIIAGLFLLVDPLSGTVYVSFLVYGLGGQATDVAVARSTDFGAHFSAVTVNGGLRRQIHVELSREKTMAL